MQLFEKQADPAMDSAASPIAQVAVTPTPAPGVRGPKGMSPRQNTSRVNTGAPPAMDAGASMQKTLPPNSAGMLPVKTAQTSEERMATMAGRPSVHEMIESAMGGASDKVSITNEAARQMKTDEPIKTHEKTASANFEKVSSAQIEELASALEYAAEQVKTGAIHLSAGSSKGTEPGEGPGALRVMQAEASTPYNPHSGQAKPGLTPPHNPPTQKGEHAEHAATQMANNLAHPVGGHQDVAMVNQKGTKTAAPIGLIRQLAGQQEKKAEDAINPAQISGGKAVEPDTREGGQSGGVAPKGGQPSMVGSAQAAIGYTKGQAKAEPKNDLATYLSEPAHSAAHDHVLQNAFTHTGQAGVKISSDQTAAKTEEKPIDGSVKTAAARAYLANLADQVTTGSAR